MSSAVNWNVHGYLGAAHLSVHDITRVGQEGTAQVQHSGR